MTISEMVGLFGLYEDESPENIITFEL